MVASSVPPGTDGPASHALLKLGKFFTRWEESPDGRAVYREGGRAGDAFYRNRPARPRGRPRGRPGTPPSG